MSLRDRLLRIRGADSSQRLELDPVPSAADRPTLAERLRRVSLGQERAQEKGDPNPQALAEAVGATEIAPGVLCLERWLEPGQRHGQVLLGAVEAAGPHARIDPAWLGRASPHEQFVHSTSMSADRPACKETMSRLPADLVCLDTETSGLAGGTGTWVFATGVLRWSTAGWRLRQYLLVRLDAESDYLEAIATELAGAELLISYNGLTFDAPLLTTRFRLSGQRDPLRTLPHLDLLRPVRRAYGGVWPDCRLASVERRLLGFERHDDLPGAEAPAAWLAWLRTGEIRRLSGVLRHNRWDLLSLAALIPRLAEVFGDPAAFDADVRAVAAHHRAAGRVDLAMRLLQSQRHCLDPAGLLDLAGHYRRGAAWEQARAIWEQLAAQGNSAARLELAKYHEHRTHDLHQALAFAVTLPPGPHRERRCSRLRAKLGERAGS